MDHAQHGKTAVAPIFPVITDPYTVTASGPDRDPTLDLNGHGVLRPLSAVDKGDMKILAVIVATVDLLDDVSVPLQQRAHLIHSHAPDAPALRHLRHPAPLTMCGDQVRANH
ncbi:hypothetical protein GCM10010236_39390 [Streptomyces eurythermus]|nr:hypothetical protein GCM10010236_39390 [Streptomyces eurythermus]